MKRIRADVEDEDQIDHSEETGKPEDSRFEEPPTPPAPGPYDNSRAGETPPFLAGIRNFKKKRLKPRKIPANGTHTEPKPSQVNGVSFNTGLLDKVHQNDRK